MPPSTRGSVYDAALYIPVDNEHGALITVNGIIQTYCKCNSSGYGIIPPRVIELNLEDGRNSSTESEGGRKL